jgi:hypothetical protein
MDASEVIELIDRAFNGVPRSSTSLRQFRLTDVQGMKGTISDDEWQAAGLNRQDAKWQDIPDAEIEECDVVLAHMSAADFRYYLPAYMRYAVTRANEPIWRSGILGMTVSSLYTSHPSLRGYVLSKFSLLTRPQREAIANFLRFVAENAAVVKRADAKRAIDCWWTEKSIRDGFSL